MVSRFQYRHISCRIDCEIIKTRRYIVNRDADTLKTTPTVFNKPQYQFKQRRWKISSTPAETNRA